MNARATAISLNSIDEKVRSLEGTSRAVPIDMKNLDDRINELQSQIGNAVILKCVDTLVAGTETFNLGTYANKNVIVVHGCYYSPNKTMVGYGMTEIIKPGETKSSSLKASSNNATTITCKHNGTSLSFNNNSGIATNQARGIYCIVL